MAEPLLPAAEQQAPAKKMGLLERITSDPYRMQMALLGLGLLGSKKRSQADRYIGGLTDVLGQRAKAMQQAPLDKAQADNLAAQTKYYEAQALSEGQPAGLFDGPATSSAMTVVSELGARIKQGEQLTPKEAMSYRTARAFLEKQDIITTEDGRVAIPPMNTGYLPDLPAASGAIPSPVLNPPGTGHRPPGMGVTISENDPFRKTDADRVVQTMETAKKYTDMAPFFDAIEQDLAQFETGQFANAELKLRALGDLVGMGDPDKLASGERLEKNINKLVSQNMEFLTGAMSEGERQFTKDFSIGMKTSVAGNRAFIGFLREVSKRASKEGQMMREYFRSNGASLDGWEAVWEKYINDNPIPIPKIGEGGKKKVLHYNLDTDTFE